MKGRWCGGGVVVMALSCQCAHEPPKPPASKPAETPQAAIHADAFAATEADAYVQAKARLGDKLFQDASWAEIANLDVHQAQRDMLTVEQRDGQVHVWLGLSYPRIAALLVSFREAEPTFVAPVAWNDVVYEWLALHKHNLACQQQRALLDVGCETYETTAVDGALARLPTELTLEPVFEGGIPVDGDHVLRGPAVRARWQSQPLEGLPLMLVEGEGIRTDANGIGVWEPRDPMKRSWTVALDLGTLAKPLVVSWPDPPRLELSTRPWSLARRAWVFEDEALAVDVGDDAIALTPAQRERVRAADDRAEIARQLADELEGRLDALLVVHAETVDVGRGRHGRRWNTARLDAEVRNAWTGAVVGQYSVTGTAIGFKEDGARQAALVEAGRALLAAMKQP